MSEAVESPELRMTILAETLDAASREAFEATVRLCHRVLAVAAGDAGLPKRTEVILSNDFEATVRSPDRRSAAM